MAKNTEHFNEKFGTEITTKRLEIVEKKDQLEAMRSQLVEAAKEFLQDYIKQEVEGVVLRNVERTRALDDAHQLGVLKSELVQTCEQALQSIELELNKPQYWIHLMQLPKRLSSDASIGFDLQKNAEKDIQDVFRRMLGYAGALLVKYQYLSEGDTSWDIQGGSLPRYRYGFTLTSKIEKLMRAYQQESGEYCKLQATLMNVQIEKEQTEAKALWEKA